MKNICLILSLIFVVGCATTEKSKDAPEGSIWREDNEAIGGGYGGSRAVDAEGLEKFLGLTRAYQRGIL